MPESPLGLVYAVRTFAASVAAKTRTIPGFFADPVQWDGAKKPPRVVSEIGTESRRKFF